MAKYLSTLLALAALQTASASPVVESRSVPSDLNPSTCIDQSKWANASNVVSCVNKILEMGDKGQICKSGTVCCQEGDAIIRTTSLDGQEQNLSCMDIWSASYAIVEKCSTSEKIGGTNEVVYEHADFNVTIESVNAGK